MFSEHQLEDDVDLNEGAGENYAPLLRFTAAGGSLTGVADALDDAQREGALRLTPMSRRTPVGRGAADAL